MGFSRLCEMYLPNESLDRASFAPVVLDSSPPKRYGFESRTVALSVQKIHQDPNFPYLSTHPIASHKDESAFRVLVRFYNRAVGSHHLDRRRFTVWIITLLQRNDKKRCYA
ncbi:hypothetical protein YC2023_106216 [Brassica napus]